MRLRDLKIFVIVATAVAGITMPGAVLTAAIDRLVPLDAAQLWTFSILLSFAVMAAARAVLAFVGRQDPSGEAVFVYLGLVALLVATTGALYAGAGVHGIGEFAARFRPRGPNGGAVMVSIVLTSCMALAGTLVATTAQALSLELSKPQIWLLGLLAVYVPAGAVVGRWGHRWGLLTQSKPEIVVDTMAGMILFAGFNIAAMLIGCVGYFGFKIELLREVFERFNVST